jgi:hypothetical protein
LYRFYLQLIADFWGAEFSLGVSSTSRMNSTAEPEQTPSEETLRMEYGEVCKSHNAITDFRAKLLALLPIASGSGIFLLLTKRSEPIDTRYLYAIGLFGFLITLGLFIYELRGIQHCKHLERLASWLEEQLHLREAQFIGRPKGRLGGFVGAQGAAYIIYPTLLAAWIFVAFVGFTSPAQTPPVQTPAAQATKKQP